MTIDLFLVDEETNAPVLGDGLPEEMLLDVPRLVPPNESPPHLFDLGSDADDLRAQRWGVVVPEEGGDALLEAIAPLIQARAKQQSLREGEKTRVYRVGKNINPNRWIFDQFKSSDTKRPRYLLLLGDLDRISLELQCALLAHDFFPGRLAFDDIAHYRTYAEKVLSWEEPEKAADTARVAMVTSRDDRLTREAYDKLMKPAFDFAQQMQDESDPRYSFILQDISIEPRVPLETVLAAARDTSRPTVLFTLSHGINTLGDVEKIHRERGKLRFQYDEYLTAEMAAHDSLLPGGVWFMFACFGAATPARSLYWQWLDRAFAGCSRFAIDLAKRNALETLANASLPPFVSALPKALLANPNGPLAVVGHADYAWPASYDLLVGTGADPWERFMRFPSLLASPYYHKRVGNAFSIFRSLHTTDEVLNGWYKEIDEAQQMGTTANVDPHELGKLWMHRQDLAQYILLGDPAVRLPLKNG